MAEARAAMHGAGVFRFPQYWFRAARPDGNVGATRESQDSSRVSRRSLKVDVAGDRGDAENVRSRRGAGVEQRQSIVNAGVDIDQQKSLSGHRNLGLTRKALFATENMRQRFAKGRKLTPFRALTSGFPFRSTNWRR